MHPDVLLHHLRTAEVEPLSPTGDFAASGDHLRAFADAGLALLACADRLPERAVFDLRTRVNDPSLDCVGVECFAATDAGCVPALTLMDQDAAQPWAAGETERSAGRRLGRWRLGFAPLAELPEASRKLWTQAGAAVSDAGTVPVAFVLTDTGKHRDRPYLYGCADDGHLKVLAGVMTALAEAAATGNGPGGEPGPLDAGGPGIDLMYRVLGKRGTRFELTRIDGDPAPVAADLYLRCELLDSEPLIWRRLRVPAAWTLADLHDVLQISFEFQDCHLHCFEVLDADGRRIRSHHPDGYENLGMDPEPGAPPTSAVSLLEALPRTGGKLGYWYDFGDDWRIYLERTEPDPAASAPGTPGAGGVACLAGERAGPPEDVGGVWGYAELLAEHAALPADRSGDDPDDGRVQFLRWLHPAAFDPRFITRDLHRFFIKRRRPAKPARWS